MRVSVVHNSCPVLKLSSRRFNTEHVIQRKLKHQNIVEMFSSFDVEDGLVIEMEYCRWGEKE